MTLAVEAVRNYSYVPNLLSSVRIVIAPAILGAAYANSRVGFTVLLATALLTDELDGPLARRWKAETPLGRRLDRWGDGLTMVLGAIGVGFIWPEVVEQQVGWMLTALAGYAMIGVHRWLQPVSMASRPGWTTRVVGVLVPAALVPLIAGWTPIPFQVAAAVHAAAALQKLVMADPAPRAKAKEQPAALLPEVQN